MLIYARFVLDVFNSASNMLICLLGYGNTPCQGNAACEILRGGNSTRTTATALCAEYTSLHPFYQPITALRRYRCPSSAYIPEDERPRPNTNSRAANAAAAAREAEAARERAREREEAQRKQTETGTMSTDAVEALFDDDDDDLSELAEMTAGVSLN